MTATATALAASPLAIEILRNLVRHTPPQPIRSLAGARSLIPRATFSHLLGREVLEGSLARATWQIRKSGIFTNHRGACASRPEARAAEGLLAVTRGTTERSEGVGWGGMWSSGCGGGFIGVVICSRFSTNLTFVLLISPSGRSCVVVIT
ncbi:hypothetical protein [Haladaptatus cibarius]|uniref:hypothetical protein n=1 Tax=Haladaptatus cibarius TaxID=453847 RepID=UPI00118588F8|nr:hypothetical protein [Haladaptatus cibarius]